MRLAIVFAALMLASCKPADGGGWRTMESAPRDGTVIEIKNVYGITPSYGLFRWSTVTFSMALWCIKDDQSLDKNLVITRCTSYPVGGAVYHAPAPISVKIGWQAPYPDAWGGSGLNQETIPEPHYRWRPYRGDGRHYVDPTHGRQDAPAYWNGGLK